MHIIKNLVIKNITKDCIVSSVKVKLEIYSLLYIEIKIVRLLYKTGILGLQTRW